jgi:ferredoxin
LYDCINCDKCVPVCPNDANFVYEAPAVAVPYDNFELAAGGGVRRVAGGVFEVAKGRQFANYADACNDCGNCDVFCPEDGGPYVEKPRFFGSLETYRKYAGRNGFYIDWEAEYNSAAGCKPAPQGGAAAIRREAVARDGAGLAGCQPAAGYHPAPQAGTSAVVQSSLLTIYGTIAGEAYVLTLEQAADRGRFETATAVIEIRLSDNQALSWEGAAPAGVVDMLPYLKLKLLAESAGDPRRVHFANVAGLQEVIGESAL